MININGDYFLNEETFQLTNRAFLYGDGVFETIKIVDKRILFFEDHYFRLMAAMRIVRFTIPANFTMEFLENQIIATATANNCSELCRARLTVYRNGGGTYMPEINTVTFLISTSATIERYYLNNKEEYNVDLFKDFYISKQLISTIKTTNKIINVLGSIYAQENDLKNCFLLNDNKNVIEVLQGNLFMRVGNKLITPPISEGCLNGVMRKQILKLAKKTEGIQVVEETISPFDLQNADELFCTNVIIGIQSISSYKKKKYEMILADQLLVQLNSSINI